MKKKTGTKEAKTAKSKVNAIPVEIKAKDEDLLGKYANVAVIHHTEREFILDFISKLPNQVMLTSRILTSPEHAKALSIALSDNVKKYEQKFGKIKTLTAMKK